MLATPASHLSYLVFLHRWRANQHRRAIWNSPGIATLVKDGRLSVSSLSSLWMPRVLVASLFGEAALVEPVLPRDMLELKQAARAQLLATNSRNGEK